MSITKRLPGTVPTLETRRESYETIAESKLERHAQVLRILKDFNKPMTAKEIAVEMKKRGYSISDERNVSHPRITELLKKGFVEQYGTKQRCEYTGKSVAVFILRDIEPVQRSIFDYV